MSLWHHLCGLFQLQAGLTDNPLGVLQLSLELPVFSGDLLKQLQGHSNRFVWRLSKTAQRQSPKGLKGGGRLTGLGTFLKFLVSPPGVQSLHEPSDLSA